MGWAEISSTEIRWVCTYSRLSPLFWLLAETAQMLPFLVQDSLRVVLRSPDFFFFSYVQFRFLAPVQHSSQSQHLYNDDSRLCIHLLLLVRLTNVELITVLVIKNPLLCILSWQNCRVRSCQVSDIKWGHCIHWEWSSREWPFHPSCSEGLLSIH